MDISVFLLNGVGSILLAGIAAFSWRQKKRLHPRGRHQQVLAMVVWGCILGGIVSVLEMGWGPLQPYQDAINISFDLILIVLAFFYRRPALSQERLIMTWILAGSVVLLITNVFFIFHV